VSTQSPVADSNVAAHSTTGRSTGSRYAQWRIEHFDLALAEALARDAQIPLTLAKLLLNRGIDTAEAAAAFLSPTIDHLADPYTMLGMREAVARIQSAIAARESILIYGDYDVDGTTAIVLLKTAIEMLGGVVRFHIPHRLRDGYGMQSEILTRTAAEGVRLVISVDTGIRAFAAAEEAERLGIDLIVTDHHLPDAATALPRALAILNPNQQGCGYVCKHICGAGVAFKLSQALLEAHDALNGTTRARTKILPSFLKMLVIATVADAVPLLGENRVFASLGVEELRRPASAGLRALMEAAKLDPATRRLTSTDIAFRLAPRINAAGRMDIASDVVELFTTREPVRARELAAKLEQLNQDRRNTEATALAEIERRIAEPEFAASRCIVIDGQGWHRGVIGILASRIVDRTAKPALVIAHEDGEAYGSGRSIDGFHLLNALESCPELFTRFGGHAHAVGFSLPSDRVTVLRGRLNAYAGLHLTTESAARKLRCHAELPLTGIAPVLFSWLSRLQPTGMGNEEPIFVAYGVEVDGAPRIMKEKHIRLRLKQQTAVFAALGWDWAQRAADMSIAGGSAIDIAYRLRHNEHPEYGGLELEIVDLRQAGTSVTDRDDWVEHTVTRVRPNSKSV
jgi:single-stranded-DNA-specific exonuclease